MNTHVIELLDRRGRVQHYVGLSDAPLTIGRAPGAEVLIDDPYVCPQHAVIEPGEQPTLRDLGSINGVYLNGARARVQTAALNDRDIIRVGHSSLRMRQVGAVLPPTAPDPLLTSQLFRLDRPLASLLGMMLVALFSVVFSVLGSSKTEPWIEAGSSIAPMLIMLAVWALMVSLLNRIVADRFRLAGHLAIACGFFLIELIGAKLIDTLAFAFGWDTGYEWLIMAFTIGVLLAMLYAHARLISTASSGVIVKRLGLASILPLALYGYAIYADGSADEFDASPDLAMLISVPAFSFTNGESTTEWATRADELLTKLSDKKDEK
jgi:pSer/pThr/pTyr-binding forkhead associated (FHA) protein